MAIINARPPSITTSNWLRSTFNGSNVSHSTVSSITFSVVGQPKVWAIACGSISASITFPSASGRAYTIFGIKSDETETSGGKISVSSSSSSLDIYRSADSITGEYSIGNFTVSTLSSNTGFLMRSSSSGSNGYITWVLYYTI